MAFFVDKLIVDEKESGNEKLNFQMKLKMEIDKHKKQNFEKFKEFYENLILRQNFIKFK